MTDGSQENLRVLRIYHAGRDPTHRQRERSLQALGIDITLVVPSSWPERGAEAQISRESFAIVELPVSRPTDVNRHTYTNLEGMREVVREANPDVLDVHEEPFSAAGRQWLKAATADLPIVMYTAQNVAKRYPPPFTVYERRSHRRAAALYPCSRQAASVARGKGFDGLLEVIPLGFDPELFRPGEQSLDDEELVLAIFGRLVPEKGVRDAVRVFERVNSVRPARLVVVGFGPEEQPAHELAAALGVADRLEVEPWLSADRVAQIYRQAHVVLVPSIATTTWTEQFGRVIVEAQASGAVVAGYATGSIPEVGGQGAVLVSEGDVAALANAVVDLIGDPFDFERRREQGLALGETRTWRRVAEQQAALYRRVVEGDLERVALPRSPARRRAVARLEFGETAATPIGPRPFALPLLRRDGFVSAAVAAVIDACAEAIALLPDRSRSS
ncbi:MAG TPA: glycosyltransferase family 4 protein [Gaiellaceae bacterium]|nr:glycosyltransferase family 4 protein [Gaiellaceae bacterium]